VEPAANVLKGIGKELEDKFLFIFDKLSVFKTKSVTAKFVKPVDCRPGPASLTGKGVVKGEKKAEALTKGVRASPGQGTGSRVRRKILKKKKARGNARPFVWKFVYFEGASPAPFSISCFARRFD